MSRVQLDSGGSYVIVEGMLNGNPLTLVRAYAPNTKQIPFLSRLSTQISLFVYSDMIIGGDFNMAQEVEMDR